MQWALLPLDSRVCGNIKNTIHQHKVERGTKSLTWTDTEQKALGALKTPLTSGSVLKLPDISIFYLFVHETKDEMNFNTNFGAVEMP